MVCTVAGRVCFSQKVFQKMLPRNHPALAQHLAWTASMRELLANPLMTALAKRLKRERERLAIVAALLRQEG
jgi:hypothetical protein